MAFRDPAAATLVRTGQLEPRLAEAERANEALVAELRGLATRSQSERRNRWIPLGASGAAFGLGALWLASSPSGVITWMAISAMVAFAGAGLTTLWTVHAPVDRALILRGRRRRVLAPGTRRICLPGRVAVESLSVAPFPVQVTVEAQGARLNLRGLVALGLDPERLQRAAEQKNVWSPIGAHGAPGLAGVSRPSGLAGLATATIADAASRAVARAVLEGTATDDWRGTVLRSPLEVALASVGLELIALTVTREPPPPP